jgi:hypothetical protein
MLSMDIADHVLMHDEQCSPREVTHQQLANEERKHKHQSPGDGLGNLCLPLPTLPRKTQCKIAPPPKCILPDVGRPSTSASDLGSYDPMTGSNTITQSPSKSKGKGKGKGKGIAPPPIVNIPIVPPSREELLAKLRAQRVNLRQGKGARGGAQREMYSFVRAPVPAPVREGSIGSLGVSP